MELVHTYKCYVWLPMWQIGRDQCCFVSLYAFVMLLS
uniref:Uncharacterized protein n=1 Tax=Rhizophora mucronata TaxID=61149 RepID=A0A2P2PMS1_RHIMU